MGALSRDHHLNQFNDLLSHTDPDDLCRAYCAAFALYSGDDTLAKAQFVSFPQEAISAPLGSDCRFHDWEPETIVNEAFALPKRGEGYIHLPRKLDFTHYENLLTLSSRLRKLENEEYGVSGHDILREMHRIFQREFEWQRGWFNKALYYRTAKIYGHKELEGFVKFNTGFTVNEISLLGFLLNVGFRNSTVVNVDTTFASITVDRDLLEFGVPIFASSMDTSFEEARDMRDRNIETAYRRSILRKKPIIVRKNNNRELICPIPDLILDRASKGLYYSIADGSGKSRAALGIAFEDYVEDLLEEVEEARVTKEFRYKTSKGEHRTPDFFLEQDGKCEIIIECKATRLTYDATYAVNSEQARGISEIAKGIFQIWKHVSAVRRGKIAQKLSDNAAGAIVTLDSWLMGSKWGVERTLREARRLSHESSEPIDRRDMIPIAFIQIDDLESAIFGPERSNLVENLRMASTDRQGFVGSLSIRTEPSKNGKFPDAKLFKALPWWANLSETGQIRRPD